MKNYFTWSFIVFISASSSLQAQNLQWAKRLGSKGDDIGNGIAVDREGNTYSVGSFSLTADFDPGPDSFLLTTHGQSDIYISKLDDDGDFVWSQQIGGKLADAANSITLDPSGYIYLTGTFRDTVDFNPSVQSMFLTGSDQSESFIAKFDFDGNFIWAQPVTRYLDTIGYVLSNAISVDSLGNAYVLGSFSDSADFDPGAGDQILTSSGAQDIFISKFDGAGNFIWAKKFGGSDKEYAYAMAIDQQGNIFCTGIFSLEADFDPGPLTYLLTAQDTLYDVFILKLNSSGEFVWIKQISGPGVEWGTGITVDHNGNSYTAGSFSSLTDFNYGSNPILLPTINDIDAYILALNSNGVFRWVQRIFGLGNQSIWSITSTPGPSGGLYMSGFFNDEALVGGDEVPKITAKGSLDIFISKLDFNGKFKFLIGMGSPGFDYSQAVAVNSSASNSIYSTGSFSGTGDFDPGLDDFLLTSAGSIDLYVVKLNDLMTGVENLPIQESSMDIQVYPNPSNSEIQINIPGIKKVNIKLMNNLGLDVQTYEFFIENEILHLDVSTLPAGTYLLQLAVNEKILTKKIVVLH